MNYQAKLRLLKQHMDGLGDSLKFGLLALMINTLGFFGIRHLNYQLDNNIKIVHLEEHERLETLFPKTVRETHRTLIKVQEQKMKKKFSANENPMKKIAGPYTYFKNACRGVANDNRKLTHLLYKIEEMIKDASDKNDLCFSGPRLQNYIIPKELHSNEEYLTCFRIKVKDNAPLKTKWGVDEVSIAYPEDCYSPHSPDMIKNAIKEIPPSTIELATFKNKKMIYTHPLFKDVCLPRCYNVKDLVGLLDHIAVSDDLKYYENSLYFDEFMNQKNYYFKHT